MVLIITRIAIIEEEYVRDAQVFAGDPAMTEENEDNLDYENNLYWEENFRDISPNVYIGIFKGADENEIRIKAAKIQGVHPNTISLIEINRPMKPSTYDLDEQDEILCPACKYGIMQADQGDYFGYPKYCENCGQMLDWGDEV